MDDILREARTLAIEAFANLIIVAQDLRTMASIFTVSPGFAS